MVNDSNPAFVRPIRSDEFLPPISLWTTLGGLLLVGSVGAAFTLSAVLQYKVTIKTAATVRPTGEIRIVQAAIAGSVKEILVKENQTVKKGDAIASIDDSQLQTRKNQLAGSIQNNQLQLAQIVAQIASLQNQQEYELSLINHNIAVAKADLQNNQRQYRDLQITTQTQVQEAIAAMELARVQMSQYQQLANTGAVAGLQVKEREQTFIIAGARLARAKATLNPSTAAVTMATERIAQERARGEVNLANLDRERKAILQRQTAVGNEINRDAKDLLQVTKDLKKTVFRTPESGRILKLDLRNPGQVVNAGQSIAQVAPGNATLVVKARVLAQDVSKIQVCKQQAVSDCRVGKVQMRISAYPYPDYGVLKGAVRAISPDTIAATQSITTATFYEVTIEPERPFLVKGDRSYFLQSGMEATAEIISQEETLLQFILRKTRLLTNL